MTLPSDRTAAQQRELIALAARLGRDRFAPRAAATTARRASRSRTTTICARPACWRSACRERYGGLGADFATYCLVAAELGRYCGATALTFNMHACSTLWTGPDRRRSRHDVRRARRATSASRGLHFARVVEEGAIYAQPFSEGRPRPPARRRSAPRATKVDGGWLINGKKIFASLSGAADYYGVLCTRGQAGDGADDARHALPRRARRRAGLHESSATGIRWACAARSRAR